MRRSGLVVLAATLACVTTGERAPQAPPASFRAVRSLVLVRSPYDRAGRPKDPLDGLDESLRARGYTTRIVELGTERKPELQPLAELFGRLELRAGTPRGERFGAATSGEIGASAGEVVAGLGVDAVASYHRLERSRFMPPPAATAPAFPGTYSGQTQPMPPRSAQGALAIVDRQGHFAVFPWGEPAGLGDSEAINAAEAIDQLLRSLTGEAIEPAE